MIPTDEEIRAYVYTGTMQETGKGIEAYIAGMIRMRDWWDADVKQVEIFLKEVKKCEH